MPLFTPATHNLLDKEVLTFEEEKVRNIFYRSTVKAMTAMKLTISESISSKITNITFSMSKCQGKQTFTINTNTFKRKCKLYQVTTDNARQPE